MQDVGRRPTAPSLQPRHGGDPVGMDLLFERFLSEERGEWPDIDLDSPSGTAAAGQPARTRNTEHGAAMTANVIRIPHAARREVEGALARYRPDRRLAGVKSNRLRMGRPEGDARAQPARRRHRSDAGIQRRRVLTRIQIRRGTSAVPAAWSSARRLMRWVLEREIRSPSSNGTRTLALTWGWSRSTC